jgi:CheY-like chemotaxis protein
MLRALGISQIREATDGADALSMCRDWRPDLIITDYIMDPIDGIEFVRLLRTAKDSPLPYVPVIMITGHTERSTIMRARDVGVNEFIAKPMTTKSLLDRITKLINSDRAWIKSSRYTGPCRRRKPKTPFLGKLRRSSDVKTKESGETTDKEYDKA